jgi:integrase
MFAELYFLYLFLGKSMKEEREMTTKAPKKKKGVLPSGNVRVQVYLYTDDKGKRHYKSFVAPSRKEAKEMATRWKLDMKDTPIEQYNESEDDEDEDITVNQAIERYLSVKKGVLSPSTLRGYIGMQRQYFDGVFGHKRLSELSNPSVQIWISNLASKQLSPKTVRNAYGLLSASLEMFAPDLTLKVKLPQKKRPDLYCPNDNDIKKLLEAIKGTDLEIAVLLAAFGPLRRGEISALTDKNVDGKIIHVRDNMVKGPDNQWYIKQPKTDDSTRDVEMPAFVIDRISEKKGKLVDMNPDYITHRFGRVLKKIDIPHFRFHDLRHYAASIMHAIGIPDQYILQRGGWASDNIMKAVYRNVIDLESVRQNKKINKHFEKLNSM